MSTDNQRRLEEMRRYLEDHPELTPLLEINAAGEVEWCFGWVSPIYEFPLEKER
jgi:hypothetical protein